MITSFLHHLKAAQLGRSCCSLALTFTLLLTACDAGKANTAASTTGDKATRDLIEVNQCSESTDLEHTLQFNHLKVFSAVEWANKGCDKIEKLGQKNVLRCKRELMKIVAQSALGAGVTEDSANGLLRFLNCENKDQAWTGDKRGPEIVDEVVGADPHLARVVASVRKNAPAEYKRLAEKFGKEKLLGETVFALRSVDPTIVKDNDLRFLINKYHFEVSAVVIAGSQGQHSFKIITKISDRYNWIEGDGGNGDPQARTTHLAVESSNGGCVDVAIYDEELRQMAEHGLACDYDIELTSETTMALE